MKPLLVMEKGHRTKLNRKFRKYLGGKRVVVLGIPDEYDYMDPALVEILKRRCARFVSGGLNNSFGNTRMFWR